MGTGDRGDDLPYAIFNFRYEFERDVQEEKKALEDIDKTDKFLDRVQRFFPTQRKPFSQPTSTLMEGRTYRAMDRKDYKVESKEEAIQFCARFPKGRKIDIYYSPFDPENYSAVEPLSEEQFTILKQSIMREALVLAILMLVSLWTTATIQSKVALKSEKKQQDQEHPSQGK